MGERATAGLSVVACTLIAMNVDVWLPPVLAAVIGALLSPSVGKGLLALAGARARRIKHVPVDGAELYGNGVPMDEDQFRATFAAYQAELNELPPPADRDAWQTAQQQAASRAGWQSLPAPIPMPSPTLAILIKPGTGTGITTLTLPTGCRTITGSGCCRQARS